MTAPVPAGRAEAALREFLLDLLRGWPEWLRAVYRLTRGAIRAAAERVPADRERDARRATGPPLQTVSGPLETGPRFAVRGSSTGHAAIRPRPSPSA